MSHELEMRSHYLGSTNAILKKWIQNRSLKSQSRIPLVGADVLIAACSNTGMCSQKALSKLVRNVQLSYLYTAVIPTTVFDLGVVSWIMNVINITPNSDLTIPMLVTRDTLDRNINHLSGIWTMFSKINFIIYYPYKGGLKQLKPQN
jgi:hypothetical protein